MKIPDSTLIIIALITAAAGILGIYLSYALFEPELLDAAQLQDYSSGELVYFHGTVRSLRSSDEFSALELDAECKLSAVYFDAIELDEGSRIAGSAEIDEYQGAKQLIIRSFHLLE